jgi:hypothetical protein
MSVRQEGMANFLQKDWIRIEEKTDSDVASMGTAALGPAAYTPDMRSITRESTDRGCAYTLIWPRRRGEIGGGNDVERDERNEGETALLDSGKRVGSSCLPRREVMGGLVSLLPIE